MSGAVEALAAILLRASDKARYCLAPGDDFVEPYLDPDEVAQYRSLCAELGVQGGAP